MIRTAEQMIAASEAHGFICLYSDAQASIAIAVGHKSETAVPQSLLSSPPSN